MMTLRRILVLCLLAIVIGTAIWVALLPTRTIFEDRREVRRIEQRLPAALAQLAIEEAQTASERERQRRNTLSATNEDQARLRFQSALSTAFDTPGAQHLAINATSSPTHVEASLTWRGPETQYRAALEDVHSRFPFLRITSLRVRRLFDQGPGIVELEAVFDILWRVSE